jgi:methylmalonyl-CoA/ethylmalonyl-CoA epimerase
MNTNPNPFGRNLAQICWVVPDIAAAERFFEDTLGVSGFTRMQNLRAQELEGTYHGEPGDFEFHLSLAWSHGWMLELIQHVSGRSIYKDFLDQHARGGVHHVACTVPEAEFEGAVEPLTMRGHRVVQALRLPVARVAYLDTSRELGIFAEVIGVTPAGYDFLDQLKRDAT